MTRPQRALLSVSDKTGLVDFARRLSRCGVELLSTGGTARSLREAGITVREVADVTGFPEIMGGRVKTLHPRIHGGILARRGVDEAAMEAHGIPAIDLVVVNLYPFVETVAQAGVNHDTAVENIDIGGPAMIRAAAKNHAHVAVVVDPQDYDEIAALLEADQAIPLAARTRLAARAFGHTAAYDRAIASYLDAGMQVEAGAETDWPTELTLRGRRRLQLRYGENPHQSGAFYTLTGDSATGTISAARQIQGKALSYNNIADADAAIECVKSFAEPACVIVKHANPCGVAVDAQLLDAYAKAFRTDPTSAFGGIIAFNRPLDGATAQAIVARQFVEVVAAPQFDSEALAAFAAKRNIRVLATGPMAAAGSRREFRSVSGGLLAQQADSAVIAADSLKVVSRRAPSETELADMQFTWRVVRFVKSNAIVYGRDGATVGIGAGQMSRVYSARLAAMKAADEGLTISGSAMASDAFFPFRDGIDIAAEYGIRAVIQPGGSIRDEEVIAAADEHGMSMVFTGMRHFRH